MNLSIKNCEATLHHLRNTDAVIDDLDNIEDARDRKQALLALIGVITHISGKSLLRKAYPGSYVRQLMGASAFYTKEGRRANVDFIKILEIDVPCVNLTALEHIKLLTEADLQRIMVIRWEALDSIKQINQNMQMAA